MKKRKPNVLGHALKSVGKYSFLVVVPTAAGVGIWYVVADMYELHKHRIWGYSPVLAAILLLVIVLSSSIFLSWIITALIALSREASSSPAQALTKSQRLLRIIVSGVLIPILVVAVFILVPVSSGSTTLTLLYIHMRTQGEYPFIRTISNTVVLSDSTDTKTEGVGTLETIHSDMCLDELFRVLETDKDTLNEWYFYGAMSKALASYDSEAQERLLEVFHKYDLLRKGSPASAESDLHQKYFEQTFETIKQQLEEETLDSERRTELLERLEKIELELKSELREFEASEPLAEEGEPILDLVLDTFLQMEKLKSNHEIYLLAKRIAADSSYETGTRRRAILLIAKLGTESDFAELLPYLQDESESITSAALKAIANLHLKISGEKKED